MFTRRDRRSERAAWPTWRACLLAPTVVAVVGCTGYSTPAGGTGTESGESRAPNRDAGAPDLDLSPEDRAGDGAGGLTPRDAGAPPPPVEPLPATCDDVDFEPCGGDPIGRWAIRLGCVQYDGSPYAWCADAELSVAMTMSGTLEIRDGGTYTSVYEYASTATRRVPPACVDGDCAALGEGARLEGGVCVQSLMEHGAPTDEGAWRFEGGFVVLVEGGADTRYQHCVDGDRMILRSPAPAPTDSTLTIVLERVD